MDFVLCRPYSDEIEDYREYKRLRQLARVKYEKGSTSPILNISPDGTLDEIEDDKTETELHDSLTDGDVGKHLPLCNQS